MGISYVMHVALNDPVPKMDIRVWLRFLVKAKVVLKSALGPRKHLLRPLPHRVAVLLLLLLLLGNLPGVVVRLPHPPNNEPKRPGRIEKERGREKGRE